MQGNKAEPVSSKAAPTHSHGDLKEAMSRSPSSDGVSIDDQSDDESASSGDEVDDETAESDLRPYIFSSEGRHIFTCLMFFLPSCQIGLCLQGSDGHTWCNRSLVPAAATGPPSPS